MASRAQLSELQGVKRKAADFTAEEYHEALDRVSQLVLTASRAASSTDRRSSVLFAAVLKAWNALLTQVGA